MRSKPIQKSFLSNQPQLINWASGRTEVRRGQKDWRSSASGAQRLQLHVVPLFQGHELMPTEPEAPEEQWSLCEFEWQLNHSCRREDRRAATFLPRCSVYGADIKQVSRNIPASLWILDALGFLSCLFYYFTMYSKYLHLKQFLWQCLISVFFLQAQAFSPVFIHYTIIIL